MMEQAPHSPSPQPSLVPVSPSSCRRTSSSLAIGWTRTRVAAVRAQPDVHARVVSPARGLSRHVDALHQDLGGDRDSVNRGAHRHGDRVRDGRRDAVHWQLADALGAGRAVCVRPLLEEHPDRRQVHRRRHDVVRHLRVGHPPVTPHDVFVQGIANGLRHAAFDLAGREDRMNHGAHFLHGDEIINMCLERGQVHAHFGDVDRPGIRAIGIALVISRRPRRCRAAARSGRAAAAARAGPDIAGTRP